MGGGCIVMTSQRYVSPDGSFIGTDSEYGLCASLPGLQSTSDNNKCG